MHHFLLSLDALDAGAELEHAAGVGGNDDFGFDRRDVFHFVVEQFERGFGLRDVVDAGGAAANVGVRQFDEFEAGNLFQEIARGVANLLSVEQVARILICDAQIERLERAQRSDDTECRKIFRDVAHLGFEHGGLRELRLFLGEEVIVFLERGAAPGGVGDDGVEFFAGEGEEIFAGEVARGVADSGVGGERSAAHLSFGDDDFDAVGVEDANGRVVESREGDLRDATGEEGDAGALLPYSGKCATEFLEEKWRFDFGQKLLPIGETEKFEHAAEANEALQSGALVKPDEAGNCSNAIGVREKSAEG